jgi:hypothetical protein
MANNLPPSVSVTDSDAPWNQDHPEPDWQCTECDRYGTTQEIKPIDPNPTCPECGAGITSY